MTGGRGITEAQRPGNAGPGGPLPLPPLEMRKLVGPTDVSAFDNAAGDAVYPYLPQDAFERVFDFGCGCGRVARRLLQQRPQPQQYVGIDLHRGMVEWCRTNLTPYAPHFEFQHHDVHNVHFNPSGAAETLPFPARDESFTLVEALSVFTHLTHEQTPHYLAEAARVLATGGYLHSSWFLFERRHFPMLHAHNAALYVSHRDPSAAVLYEREWVRAEAANAGLVISTIIPPGIRGHQWILAMTPLRAGLEQAAFPPDDAPEGTAAAPLMPDNPSRIGSKTRSSGRPPV